MNYVQKTGTLLPWEKEERSILLFIPLRKRGPGEGRNENSVKFLQTFHRELANLKFTFRLFPREERECDRFRTGD